MMVGSSSLAAAVRSQMPLATRIFDAIRERTADHVGITRPAWSSQDLAAAEIIAEAARELGLTVEWDLAGNLLCSLSGTDSDQPRILTGSHLDSVPTGGHYDGLAGVVAGISVLAAFRQMDLQPACDITTIGLRGEESVWYGIAYIGSRLAVGTLPLEQLDELRRGDTGRSLAEHMSDVGVDVDELRRAKGPTINSNNTRAFFELHIEQGPVLVGEGVSVGIPTTIRGNVRFPYAHCLGVYGHSGALPRAYRNDAALAAVELVHTLDSFWIEQEAMGVPDTVFTVGKLFTDPTYHGMTKVPGRCDFTLNFGGTTKTFLDACRERTVITAGDIAQKRRVEFELGECVGSDPTPLDNQLRGVLADKAESAGIQIREFATVGHDASIFARAGIPSAMVLVRNDKGSHNPDEAMEMSDFADGSVVLAEGIVSLLGYDST